MPTTFLDFTVQWLPKTSDFQSLLHLVLNTVLIECTLILQLDTDLLVYCS